VLLYEIDSNGSGLSYLCLVQGEKAQFSRLDEYFKHGYRQITEALS
jgi:hypothetical protein